VTSLATTSISTGNSGAKQLSRQFHEAVFLVFLWILARSFKASNPRDYIYGVLGMAVGLTHTVLPIDYSKSLREVYLDATVVILNAGCISALHTMLYAFPMIGTNYCHENHQTGPSWVFDFSYKGMEWAESFLNEESWALRGHNASRYAVGADGIGLHSSSGQLIVRTSMVDEIACIIDFPRQQKFDADTRGPAASAIEAYAFVEFLSVAQVSYRRDQDVHGKWGQRSLFESLQEMPQASRRKLSISALLNSPNFDQLLDEIQDLGSPPDQTALSSLYRDKKPLLSELMSSVLISSEVPISFFVTLHGLCGLCMPGAQIGDQVVILFRDAAGWIEVPFVVRSNGVETYSMISVAWVPKSWKGLCKHRGTLEPQWITFA
jgi:hypothetical protein